jgi:hypothetical protein
MRQLLIAIFAGVIVMVIYWKIIDPNFHPIKVIMPQEQSTQKDSQLSRTTTTSTQSSTPTQSSAGSPTQTLEHAKEVPKKKGKEESKEVQKKVISQTQSPPSIPQAKEKSTILVTEEEPDPKKARGVLAFSIKGFRFFEFYGRLHQTKEEERKYKNVFDQSDAKYIGWEFYVQSAPWIVMKKDGRLFRVILKNQNGTTVSDFKRHAYFGSRGEAESKSQNVLISGIHLDGLALPTSRYDKGVYTLYLFYDNHQIKKDSFQIREAGVDLPVSQPQPPFPQKPKVRPTGAKLKDVNPESQEIQEETDLQKESRKRRAELEAAKEKERLKFIEREAQKKSAKWIAELEAEVKAIENKPYDEQREFFKRKERELELERSKLPRNPILEATRKRIAEKVAEEEKKKANSRWLFRVLSFARGLERQKTKSIIITQAN